MEEGPATHTSSELAGWMASTGLLEAVALHCYVPFELSHSQLAHTRSGPSEICPAMAELQVTSLDCLCNWMAAAPPGSQEVPIFLSLVTQCDVHDIL